MLILVTRHLKIFLKKIIYQIWNLTSQRQNYRFYHFYLVSMCLGNFLKTFSMYARPISVPTKVHFKNLQFFAVTYDMGILSCAFDVV